MTVIAQFSFARGTDNQSVETGLVEGAARRIVNLDVLNNGGLITRRGIRKLHDGSWHSLFAHPNYLLGVCDGALVRVKDGLEVVASAVGERVAYALHNHEVYWSDGNKVGRVSVNGEALHWGLPSPPLPQVVAVANGGFNAGAYQVAMSAIHQQSGIESGVAGAVEIVLGENEGIELTTPAATGVQFAVYVSDRNAGADSLREVTRLPGGVTFVVTSSLDRGKRLESLYAVRPYPCQQLVSFAGRLWGGDGSTLWYTSEYSPHWLFPQSGYFQFESAIQSLGVTASGLYVGLESAVYFLDGTNPHDMRLRKVGELGSADCAAAIPTDVFVNDEMLDAAQCAFFDREGGLCIGKDGGNIEHPNKMIFSAGYIYRADSVYRWQNGMRQLVFLVDEAVGSNQADDVGIEQQFNHGIQL